MYEDNKIDQLFLQFVCFSSLLVHKAFVDTHQQQA